jgi:hypothetical protein
VIILSTDNWIIYFTGNHWPRIIRNWKLGTETAIMHAVDPLEQIEELKSRLRYVGVINNITRPTLPKKKTKRNKS